MSIFFKWAPNYGSGQGLSHILSGQGKGVCIRRQSGTLPARARCSMWLCSLKLSWGWQPFDLPCADRATFSSPSSWHKGETGSPLNGSCSTECTQMLEEEAPPAQRPARLNLCWWADVSPLAWWASRGWVQRIRTLSPAGEYSSAVCWEARCALDLEDF